MYKIINENAVSIPYVISVSKSGDLRERFKTYLPGEYIQEGDSNISPRLVKLYEDGDLYTRSLISKVSSDEEPSEGEEVSEEDERELIDPEGFQDPDLANPSGAEVPSTPEEQAAQQKVDYSTYNVDTLKETIGGRGLTIPTDARKPDLIKILEDDDAKSAQSSSEGDNPFTNAE